MISIIISTYKPLLLKRISLCIQETIGVEYEIIAIENDAKYSICEAYNLGVERANFPYLCFVHEDVLFKVKDWGKRLISLCLADETIGLIGVAGTKYKSTYPSAIGQSPLLRYEFLKGHIFHWVNEYTNFDNSKEPKEIEDVVCIDGVFMFTHKKVFKNCRFDDKLLTHFHGYDIDFSLQVFFQSFRVIVDRVILLDHHSSGDYSKENTLANRVIAKKWQNKLPVATSDLHFSKSKLISLDLQNWYYFIKTAIKRKLNIKIK